MCQAHIDSYSPLPITTAVLSAADTSYFPAMPVALQLRTRIGIISYR